MPVNMIAETGSSLSKVERISSEEDCSVLMIESIAGIPLTSQSQQTRSPS